VLPDPVQTFIDAEIAANQTEVRDLRAVILNGTLKPSPTPSHADGPIGVASRGPAGRRSPRRAARPPGCRRATRPP